MHFRKGSPKSDCFGGKSLGSLTQRSVTDKFVIQIQQSEKNPRKQITKMSTQEKIGPERVELYKTSENMFYVIVLEIFYSYFQCTYRDSRDEKLIQVFCSSAKPEIPFHYSFMNHLCCIVPRGIRWIIFFSGSFILVTYVYILLHIVVARVRNRLQHSAKIYFRTKVNWARVEALPLYPLVICTSIHINESISWFPVGTPGLRTSWNFSVYLPPLTACNLLFRFPSFSHPPLRYTFISSASLQPHPKPADPHLKPPVNVVTAAL